MNMTENDGQMSDDSEFRLGKMAEWGHRRAQELEAQNRLGDSNNDPFQLWLRPSRQKAAMWARDIWVTVLDSPARIWTRRIHYILLGSGKIPPWRFNRGRCRKDGTHARHDEPYADRNADTDYSQLRNAFRDARFAGLIDAEVIEDHKNPDIEWAGEPALSSLSPYSRDADNTGQFSVDESVISSSPYVPCPIPAWTPLTDRPIQFENTNIFSLNNATGLYHALLPYRLAIISEKSGVNDAVETALSSLTVNVDYLEMTGTASVTRVLDYVRGIRDRYRGKEILFFYLADYDMVGRNMPWVFAQKVRYELERQALLNESEIPTVKMYHLALTEQQVKQYRLPPAPEVKNPKQAKYELDALIQLHPEALKNIIIEALERYDDPELRESCNIALEKRHDEWVKEAHVLLEDVDDEACAHFKSFAPVLKKAWSKIEKAVTSYDQFAKNYEESIEAYNRCLSFELDVETLRNLKDGLDLEPTIRKIEPPDCPLIAEIGGDIA